MDHALVLFADTKNQASSAGSIPARRTRRFIRGLSDGWHNEATNCKIIIVTMSEKCIIIARLFSLFGGVVTEIEQSLAPRSKNRLSVEEKTCEVSRIPVIHQPRPVCVQRRRDVYRPPRLRGCSNKNTVYQKTATVCNKSPLGMLSVSLPNDRNYLARQRNSFSGVSTVQL